MTPPPQRVRVAKLQDTQLDAVVAIDAARKQQLHRAGVPAADEPPRGVAGIAKLTRQHNVLVADADGVVAGYAAWRDESPGVAYLEELAVKTELQPHGIAEKLVEAVRAEATGLSLPILLTRVWKRDAPGEAFLQKNGFVPLSSHTSERAARWLEEQQASGGHGLAKDGQVVMVQPLL
jgi:amino-acid N-acetyltransferase